MYFGHISLVNRKRDDQMGILESIGKLVSLFVKLVTYIDLV
jgi:hypothetical protein